MVGRAHVGFDAGPRTQLSRVPMGSAGVISASPGGAAVEAPHAGRPQPHDAELRLRRIAGWLLPGAPEISAITSPSDAEQLIAAAERERILGPVLIVLDSNALDVPDDVIERARSAHEEAMLWCMHVEHRMLDVKDWFDEAGGIDFRVVKGPAVAHLDDEDPSLRAFADLDLLIRGRDFDRAIAALEEHGAERRIPQRRPGFDRRFNKSVGLVCPDGVELDVHRTFTGGAHGFRIPVDRLFENPERFEVGGEEFLAPDRVCRALHAAYHAMVGSPVAPLRTLRDLAGYITSPDLTPELLAGEARRWRGEAVLYLAVTETFDTLTFQAPAWREWLETVEVDPAEVELIRGGHRPARWPVRWSTLRELPWRDRGAFLWAVAVPSREARESRGISLADRMGTIRSRLDKNSPR